MSVLGAYARRDQGTTPVLPNFQLPPSTTGFFQNIGAGFNQAVAGPHSTQNAKAIYESRQYDQIVAALKAEGEQATDMVPSVVSKSSPFYHPVPGEQDLPDGRVLIPEKRDFTNPFSEGVSFTRDVNPVSNLYMGGDAAEQQQIWTAVQRVRQRKPDFLKSFPDAGSVDAVAQKQRQADEAAAQTVTSRASTLGTIGAFVGGMAGSLASGDPEAVAGLFTGGTASAAGKSVARQVLTHAAEGATVNTAAGVIGIPGQSADAASLGQPMTTGDVVHGVVENAGIGAVLGGAHPLIPHVAGAVGSVASSAIDTAAQHIPAAVRDPIVAASIRAGTVKDRTLLTEFQRAQNPYTVNDTATPTEKAAAHVVTDDVETQEQSPFQPSAAGANNDRLTAVAKALHVDLTPPELPTSAPTAMPTVPDRSANATSPSRPASYFEALDHAEGRTANPAPGTHADGFYQFEPGTWRQYVSKVTDTTGMSDAQVLALRHDKPIADRAVAMLTADNARILHAHQIEDSPGNLYLAHVLGPESAVRVLRADPDAPIESTGLSTTAIKGNRFSGKTADQVIAWAHKRIGAAVDAPPARPDAVPDESYDYASPAPYTVENLKPSELTLDAPAMQYKSGADDQGITDALRGVDQWNPLLSQQILAWEPNEGGRVVVDGHQRVGLAKRLSEAGADDISIPTVVIREADGIDARTARTMGALRNIANGTGSLIDNAKVLRDAPDAATMLPTNGPQARDSIGLSKLSYEAFGAAVNDVADPRVAAQVGLNAPNNPEAHMPILSLLAKERIHNPREAAAITRQALADGFGTAQSHQLSMLGDVPQQSLYAPIARISAAAAQRLRSERRVFATLKEKAGAIEGAGNVLDRTANESKVLSNDEALTILERTAHRAGPVRDALVRAARSELSGARRGAAVDQFLHELGGIDLRSAAGEGEAGGGDGSAPVEPGRGIPAEATDGDLFAGSEPGRDLPLSERGKFSDPVGEGAKQQTALLEHDLRAEGAKEPDVRETLDDIEADAAERGVKLSLLRGSNRVEIGLIDTTKAGRGQGVGTEFMDRLTRWADQNDKRLALTPDTSFGASSKKRLADFYKRFGFVENKGRNKDYEISAAMYREPEPAEAAQSAAEGKGASDPAKPEKPAENASGAAPEPIHLFDLPATGFRLSEEGDRPVSIKQALESADADEAAAKALRDCL